MIDPRTRITIEPKARPFQGSDETLVAGLDVEQDVFKVAIINPQADHFPWTDDLHRARSLHTFERFWKRRFHPITWTPDPPPIVAVSAVQHPGLMLWLETRGARVEILKGFDLEPFLRQAVNYEIPRSFRRAHALAQCISTRIRARRDLRTVAATLNEINFQIQDATQTLWRLAAVCNRGSG